MFQLHSLTFISVLFKRMLRVKSVQSVYVYVTGNISSVYMYMYVRGKNNWQKMNTIFLVMKVLYLSCFKKTL